jgi:poly(A) polymerase
MRGSFLDAEPRGVEPNQKILACQSAGSPRKKIMSLRESAQKIVQKLRDAGHEAVFAGGCVRDMLLGQEAKDYDIATSAPAEVVQQIFPKSVSVGAHFGVVIVKMDGTPCEVATYREDGVYRDGRRPESVIYSTAEKDAQRRDFTVNGLFFDPLENRVIDYVGGQADLEQRTLRAIGEPRQRFEEDHLRLLRAVRFACSLGFTIEPATWTAVVELAPRLAHIAIERVRVEFEKIMLHRERVRGFDLLCESGLMRHIIPEIYDLQGCEQPPEFHPEGDVYVHTRLMLTFLPDEVSLPLVLSVLLHDIAKPCTRTWDPVAGRARFNEHDKVGAQMTETILRRLRFPNDIIVATQEMVAQHMTYIHVQQMRPAKLKRFMARPTFEEELQLHRVDCLGSHAKLDNLDFLQRKKEEFAQEPLIPPRLVDGRDLIQQLGFKPGPVLGQVLEEIQIRQLEGQISSAEEALSFAREWQKNTPQKES